MTKRRRKRRGGPPRKPGPRHPSGRLKAAPHRPDLGTPEMQRRKQRQRAADPLDALLEHDKISLQLHEAGEQITQLWRAAGLPHPHPRAMDPDATPGAEGEDSPQQADRRKRAEADWRRLCALWSRRERDAVTNLVIYHRWPRWFIGVARLSDERDREAFMSGMVTAAEFFGIGARRAA